MKTVIFLSQYRYNYYRLEELYQPNQYRFVALLGNRAYTEFPSELKKYFARIYPIFEKDHQDLSAEFTLDFEEACQAVETEIKLASGAKNVLLVCGDEFNISLLGKLRDKYKIPGPGYKQLAAYRNKIVMKKQLQKAKVRIPKFIKFDKLAAKKNPKNYFEKLSKTLDTPFIIKPISGAVSLTTQKIENLSAFKKHLPTFCNPKTDFEAEEFITGTLYHCDSLVQNKKILIELISEYLSPNLMFTEGKVTGSIPLRETDPLKIRIEKFSKQILQALGLIDGVTHMELFLTPKDELVFLEVAARPVGAAAVPNYIKVYDINLAKLHIEAQMRIPIKITKPQVRQYTFFVLIPYLKGKIVSLNEPNLESRYEIQWKVKPGDIIKATSQSIVEVAGICSVANDNYDILYSDFEKLKNYKPMMIDAIAK